MTKVKEMIPDYYITPYEIQATPRTEMVVWAGLSWATPPQRGYLTWNTSEDIYIPSDAKVVAVTACRHRHLRKIEDQIDKWPEVCWVVGGPATTAPDADLVFGGGKYNLDQILAVPEIGMPKSWTLGIGTGCYWSRCSYCNERGQLRRRKGWRSAVDMALSISKSSDILFLSPPTMLSPEVDLVASMARDRDKAMVSVTMRPEDLLLTQNLHGVDVGMGLVALSDPALRVLHRGHTAKQAMDAAEHAIGVGATIHVFVNTSNPEENIGEAQTTIRQLNDLRSAGANILDVGPLLYQTSMEAKALPHIGCAVTLDESSWWMRSPTLPNVKAFWESTWEEMAFTKVREAY